MKQKWKKCKTDGFILQCKRNSMGIIKALIPISGKLTKKCGKEICTRKSAPVKRSINFVRIMSQLKQICARYFSNLHVKRSPNAIYPYEPNGSLPPCVVVLCDYI